MAYVGTRKLFEDAGFELAARDRGDLGRVPPRGHAQALSAVRHAAAARLAAEDASLLPLVQ